MLEAGWQAAISGATSGSVGVAELLGRYKSSPASSLKRVPALVYVLVNVGAGILALYLVRAFGWNFGQKENITLWRILVAGFGALALFRSSLFVAKIGGSDVSVGPSVVLGALLDSCDRSIDRASAREISDSIDDKLLKDLDPAAVSSALPVLCLALMQNFPASDQALLAADLNKVGQDQLPPEVEMRAVIVQLSKYLGPRVVQSVLKHASSIFTKSDASNPPPPTPQQAAAVVTRAKAIVRGLAEPVQPEQSGDPQNPSESI